VVAGLLLPALVAAPALSGPAAATTAPKADLDVQLGSSTAAAASSAPPTATLLPFSLPQTSINDQDFGQSFSNNVGQLVMQATGPALTKTSRGTID
jgi:hypothetical protein